MEEKPTYADLEEKRIAIANFRCDLVAPLAELLERREGHGELQRGLLQLAEQQYILPTGESTTVSISSLRRWLGNYRKGGLEALKPALRSDYGNSRAIPAKWIQEAIALRAQVPARTATMLVEILKRQDGYPGDGINPHTLDKILRRMGHTRHQARHRKKKPARRWSAQHVNDLWQGDATPGIWLPHPKDPERKTLTKLLLWIDDFSRLVVHAEFFYDEKLPRMERTLKLALLRRGKPSRLYTDYVPRNIIDVMCPTIICARQGSTLSRLRGCSLFRPHNIHKEFSHDKRFSSSLQIGLLGNVSFVGGSQARSAASFVRMVSSA